MCVVKASASDLNAGNGYVVCGRERAFGGSGFVVFVCFVTLLIFSGMEFFQLVLRNYVFSVGMQ